MCRDTGAIMNDKLCFGLSSVYVLSPLGRETTMPKADLNLVSGTYAPVADRVALFYKSFPTGRIVTTLISRSDGAITFRAAVFRSADEVRPAATGWALEKEGDGEVNMFACLENTETSAVGRALANLGFLASSQRPSAEEMEKVARARRAHERAAIVAEPGSKYVAEEPIGKRERLLVDLHDLLGRAQRAALPPDKAAEIVARATHPAATTAEIERLERSLRRWLLRQPGQAPPEPQPGERHGG